MEPIVATEFTPWASLAGGVLIGLSALAVMIFFGRVTGISGITTGALMGTSRDWLWRIVFIVGLISAPIVMMLLNLEFLGEGTSYPATVSDNFLGLALAGLCVGVGTVLGSGCTSGHGVCGLGRLSARSLVAVMTFMATAVATVAVIRHVL